MISPVSFLTHYLTINVGKRIVCCQCHQASPPLSLTDHTTHTILSDIIMIHHVSQINIVSTLDQDPLHHLHPPVTWISSLSFSLSLSLTGHYDVMTAVGQGALTIS